MKRVFGLPSDNNYLILSKVTTPYLALHLSQATEGYSDKLRQSSGIWHVHTWIELPLLGSDIQTGISASKHIVAISDSLLHSLYSTFSVDRESVIKTTTNRISVLVYYHHAPVELHRLTIKSPEPVLSIPVTRLTHPEAHRPRKRIIIHTLAVNGVD